LNAGRDDISRTVGILHVPGGCAWVSLWRNSHVTIASPEVAGVLNGRDGNVAAGLRGGGAGASLRA
jgi:hypothetical protein